MRLIILSDIHGNLSAFKAVLADIESKYDYDGIALLGDIINYGMRPNEVIQLIKTLKNKLLVNIYGNHENALKSGEVSHFSTERGREILNYTKTILESSSYDFILNEMNKKGEESIVLDGLKILFVHGSVNDPYWGKMTEKEMEDIRYSEYDYVISGHSHIPNLTEKFYSCENPEFRNKKRTVFLNPGSVGQPRNHNNRAQYVFWDTSNEVFHFNSIEYNIKEEQNLFNGEVDSFYRDRLKNGI